MASSKNPRKRGAEDRDGSMADGMISPISEGIREIKMPKTNLWADGPALFEQTLDESATVGVQADHSIPEQTPTLH
jgi:hypothetical protein